MTTNDQSPDHQVDRFFDRVRAVTEPVARHGAMQDTRRTFYLYFLGVVLGDLPEDQFEQALRIATDLTNDQIDRQGLRR